MAALQLPDASGPLFQLVRLYDSSEIDKAFGDTLACRQQRLCFILPGRVTFQRESNGRTMIVRKELTFALLICDTDRRTGTAAVFGGPNNQGTLALHDQVVDALTGQHLGFFEVCLAPDDGDDITVTSKDDSDSGRKGWFQSFATAAGKSGVGIYG